jgi:Photosynthesis affected mutant 68
MQVGAIISFLLGALLGTAAFRAPLALRWRSSLYDNDAGSSTRGKGFGNSAKPEKPAETTTLPSEQADLKTQQADDSFKEVYEKTDYFKKELKKREDALDEKIQRLREEEQLMASDPSVGAVPELVANRMLGRIVVLAGLPVFGGLAIFVGAFFYFKKYDLVVQPAMVAYATQVPFILGLLGITYGILSSSWDKEEGSMLGIEEFKTNLQRVKDGLTRTSDTAKLKEEIDREQGRLRRK